MTIHALSTITLSNNSHLRRDKPRRTIVKDDGFWERYDSKTLIYDAYHCPKRQTLRLLMPRSFNLAPLIKSAQFTLDGVPLRRYRWRKWRHHEAITFRGVLDATRLSVAIEGKMVQVKVNPVETGLADLNCLYTLSLNNDLDWIKDWALFHVVKHNLQAVVVFDNGSTAYDLAALDDALGSVPGLQAVRVIKADVPFGPLDQDCEYRTDAKFLQVAMLNLARDRFMTHSRAWLNLDVDELLVSPTGENVFDATVANRWGHFTFPGYWHYPNTNGAQHADHRLIRKHDRTCPPKFSLQPAGVFGDYALQVHCLERINRKFNAAADRFWFVHCHGISKSWKYARSQPEGPFEEASSLVKDALDDVFGKPHAS